MKTFELPKDTTLEQDLENPKLLAEYQLFLQSKIEEDDIKSGKVSKTEIKAKNRLNELIDFNKDVNSQINSIEKTDEFINYDEKGKDIVQEWCNVTPECKFRKRSGIDAKEAWDVSLELNGEKMLVEIKMRKNDSNYYDEWILENKKYLDVTNLANKYNFKPVYCNIFTDDKMIMWDMEIIKNKEITNKYMNKQTMGDDEKKDKQIYMLKNNEAFLITTI